MNKSSESTTISTQFKIYYQNVRGLGSKTKRFYCTSSSYDFDIITLTETWLRETHFTSELFISSYFVYRKDRYESNSDYQRGGGVLVAIKSKFESDQVILTDTTNLESICVRAKLKNGIFMYVYCLYIPPNSDASCYQNHLNAIKSIQLNNMDTLIIVGDFNIPNVNWINYDFDSNIYIPTNIKPNYSAEFLLNLQTDGIFQINSINNKDMRKLDLIFTNDFSNMEVTSTAPLTKIDAIRNFFKAKHIESASFIT